MKKLNAFLVSLVLLLCVSIPVFAEEAPTADSSNIPQEVTQILGQTTTILSVEKEVRENGDVGYFVTTESQPLTRGTFTKTYGVAYFFYNYKEVLLWDAFMDATFSVNEGVSVTCTKVTKEFNVFKGNWSCATSPTRSGNKATWNIEAKQKVLGIVVETQRKTLMVACDKYGDRV